jgi:hypothetical protein
MGIAGFCTNYGVLIAHLWEEAMYFKLSQEDRDFGSDKRRDGTHHDRKPSGLPPSLLEGNTTATTVQGRISMGELGQNSSSDDSNRQEAGSQPLLPSALASLRDPEAVSITEAKITYGRPV